MRCRGTPELINLLSLGWAQRCCDIDNFSAHAGCPAPPAPAEGSVRLIDGFGGTCDDLHSGTVEIYHDGRWGAICDQDISTRGTVGLRNPTVPLVVCRQLGFTYGTRYNPFDVQFNDESSDYSETYAETEESQVESEVLWLDQVQCKGTEERVSDCYLGEGYFERESCGFRVPRLSVACRNFPVVEAFEGDAEGGKGALASYCI
jgi:hypothetical protein